MPLPFSALRRGRATARTNRTRSSHLLLALGIVLAGALTGSASPAVAGAPSTAHVSVSPSPSPTPQNPDPVLSVSPVSAGVVAPGQTLSISTRVVNPGDTEIPAASGTVSLGNAPLADAAAIDAWLGATSRPALTVVDRPVFTPAPPEGEARATSSVAPEALGARAAGVYPIEATFGTLVARSVVTLADPAAVAPVGIAVVVAVTAGPQTVGVLDADTLTELTGPEGRLTRILDGVTGTSAILAVDPAIPASIRVLGDTAPTVARAWLARLETIANERFALQYGDADVAVQVAAGRTDLLAPTTLAYAAPPTPEPDASPAPAPTASAAPTVTDPRDTAALLAVRGARQTAYWPAGGIASDQIVQTLTAWAADAAPMNPGASDAAPLTLVATDAVEGGITQSAASSAQNRLGVYDAGVSDALAAVAAASDFERGAPLAELTARLWLTTSQATGTLLVTSGRLGELSEHGLSAAIEAVRAAPGSRPAMLADLLTAPAEPVTLTATPEPDRVAALQQLEAGAAQLDVLATALEDPTQLTGRERTAIMQLIGGAWLDDPTWAQALGEHLDATQATLEAVAIQPMGDVQLGGYSASLPVYVENSLPWPARLVLTAVSDDLRLNIEPSTELIAAPGVNTRVQIPVNARVGSGDVTVELKLYTSTFQQIGPTRHVEVAVRAEWELYGIAILSTVVGGLLIAGIIRTILRRRRARRATPDPTEVEHG